MMSSEIYKWELRKTVASFQTMDELEPFIEFLSVDQLKDLVLQNIPTLNYPISKKLHFDLSSIDQILPTDVIGHVLSFQSIQELYTTKYVNKQWNELSKQTQKNYFLNAQRELDQNCPIKYDQNSNITWIVDKGRQCFCLTKLEKEMGFKFGGHEIMELFEKYKSGDRIFIVDDATQWTESINCEIDIAIIGVQSKVTFAFGGDAKHIFSIANGAKIYFQNLSFAYYGYNRDPFGLLRCSEEGELWVNKCEFEVENTGIHVSDQGSMNLRDCTFHDGICAISLAVNSGRIDINDCVFEECQDGIIIESPESCDVDSTLQLRCKGNIFKNIEWYPICEEITESKDTYLSLKRHSYSLENNIVQKNNSKYILTDVKECVIC